MIGNFDVADSVVGIYVNPGLNYAYYYIDQVSVRLLPEVMAVPDEGIRAWWVGDGLSIRYPASFQPSEVSIHDASGKAVFEARFSRLDHSAWTCRYWHQDSMLSVQRMASTR
ncbi:MAG: hypothetical protein IPI41_17005 [Flavobacteriales bacterium]|nr:hypothetical protein [Flavobacteriales bacterium]